MIWLIGLDQALHDHPWGLKQDSALKGTMEAEQYPSLWQMTVLFSLPLWLIMWESLTTSQQESLFVTE